MHPRLESVEGLRYILGIELGIDLVAHGLSDIELAIDGR